MGGRIRVPLISNAFPNRSKMQAFTRKIRWKTRRNIEMFMATDNRTVAQERFAQLTARQNSSGL